MPCILDIKDLRKSYEGGFEALKGVTLEIKEGEIFSHRNFTTIDKGFN
jgi:ABC-2 type transport system ATP-binding protein